MAGQVLNLVFSIPTFLLITSWFIGVRGYKFTQRLSKFASLLGVLLSLAYASFIFLNGPQVSEILGWFNLGYAVRLDGLSLIMYCMVSIIGLVVLRYSDNYLEGDEAKNDFIGSLALTVGLVQLMVIAGNLLTLFLGWVLAGVTLRRLIVFYAHRSKAQIAAKKKQIVSILGNLSLFTAFALLFFEFGTGDLKEIFEALSKINVVTASLNLELAAIFLVISASLKSAQLPSHGWLIEVMEAPTPVSALLHAGLLNAGPFLMIRFAFLLDSVSVAPIVLFSIGAITAFYGAIVFSTQTTIKNALAYSSVGHMGFSMMSSGLGVYAAGLLHLVAHSFYKAHAFLYSGSLIEKVRTNQPYGFKREGNFLKIFLGTVVGIGFFALTANFWGISLESEIQLLFISSVVLAGIIKLFVTTIDSTSLPWTLVRIVGLSFLITNLFFSLESLSGFVIQKEIPAISEPSAIIKSMGLGVFAVFFLTVISQSLAPAFNQIKGIKNLGVHVRQGFYINVFFNKVVRSLNKKG